METSLTNDELVKLFKLSNVSGVGPKKILKLLDYFGNIGSIFEAKKTDLTQTLIFNEKMLYEFEKIKLASDENFLKAINECKEREIKILTIVDKEYPKGLTFLSSPPISLFLLGKTELLKEKKIAIVGTREPSQKAKNYTEEISKYFATKGFVIVSGGATGIDTAAHKATLSCVDGKTISVLGSGFNYFFPPENIDLFEQIKKNGLLISEHLPNFKGSRISYLQRNRITSGLSNALILIASGGEGGSLTQASIAYSQKKPIFCPSLDSEILPNAGIKQAIEKYRAIEIKNPEQVLKAINSSITSFF